MEPRLIHHEPGIVCKAQYCILNVKPPNECCCSIVVTLFLFKDLFVLVCAVLVRDTMIPTMLYTDHVTKQLVIYK